MDDEQWATDKVAEDVVAQALRLVWHPQPGDEFDGHGDDPLTCAACIKSASVAVSAMRSMGWRPKVTYTRCVCDHPGRFCWVQCQNTADGSHVWPGGRVVCEPCSRGCDPERQMGRVQIGGRG